MSSMKVAFAYLVLIFAMVLVEETTAQYVAEVASPYYGGYYGYPAYGYGYPAYSVVGKRAARFSTFHSAH